MKESGGDGARLERGKAARVGRTLRLVGELPASYRTASRREKELLTEAERFCADIQVLFPPETAEPAPVAKASLFIQHCIVPVMFESPKTQF